MKNPLQIEMLRATRLTREGRLEEAMAILRGALPGDPTSTAPEKSAGGWWRAPLGQPPRSLPMAPPLLAEGASTQPRFIGAGRGDLSETLRGVFDHTRFAQAPSLGGLGATHVTHAPVSVPEGARFEEGLFANSAGSRTYKIYVPSGYSREPLPLVVMLHGCTQSPDDFAAGTRMNELSEEQTFLVVYPAQAQSANVSRCWNWFRPGDQERERGEPSLIAGITRQIMRDFSVDSRRVYIAGLSAGGAAAAIMGSAYPDLYSAIGVHSGLACGAASDMPSAFTAMREGGPSAVTGFPQAGHTRCALPTIVFHGDRDATVNPVNGDQIVAQAKAGVSLQTNVSRGEAPGGLRYTRIAHVDESGRSILEHWILHGAGHAWSGGSSDGSYADPRGPDASREMIRFFRQHPAAMQPL